MPNAFEVAVMLVVMLVEPVFGFVRVPIDWYMVHKRADYWARFDEDSAIASEPPLSAYYFLVWPFRNLNERCLCLDACQIIVANLVSVCL